MSAVSPVPGTQSKLAKIASRAATAWMVLAIGCALSAVAAFWVASQVEHEARMKFEADVGEARDAIERRMQAYADVLYGVRALFIASESISRGAFRRYVLSLDLDRRYRGIQVVNFNRRVPAEEKRDYETAVRRDTSIDPNGYPHFAIKPPGERPEYFPVEYLEPMAGNEEAFGLDAGGDSVRFASVERARDSGQLVASGRVTIVRGDTRHAGFVLRLPLYRDGMPQTTVAQRRQALVGLITSSYRMNHLMQGVLSEPLLRRMRIRIHDAGYTDSPAQSPPPAAENLMFDSSGLLTADSAKQTLDIASDEDTLLTKALSLDVGGRRWNLYFSAGPEFVGASDRWLTLVALLGGITITLLLFGLTRSLATTGSRAVKLADRITLDLRKSEASLAEAQRMTQQLIEALPNPIFFKDTDGRYLGVNKAWETFFGVPREAFIGKTVHDLYPQDPETAERLHALDQVLWNSPGTQVHEAPITTADARRHDAIYYKATFTRADGSVAGLIGTIVDITERKEIERRFELTFNYAAVGILHTSLDSRMLLANKRFLDMTGYTLEELQQQPTAKIVHPDDVNTDIELEQQLLQGKIDTYQSEKRYLGKHGGVISTKRTTSVARSADGTPQYYIRVIEDVTESKLNEERYRAMFENAAVGITRVDLTGALVDVNQKFCDMLGYARDELIGKAVKDITHPDDYGQGAQFRGRMTQGEVKSAIGEKRFVRRNGTLMWALRTMSVVRDDAGDPQYVISVVEDITERKQAELRQAMEHAITRVLTEAETLADAVPRIIQIICESMQWHCGTRWVWDQEAMLLRCGEMWGVDTPEVRQFLAASANGTIMPDPNGQGLVRRTFASGEPLWVADVTQVKGLIKRAALVTKAGLHGAFAFPLLLGNEVLGVMEFFHRDVREPDAMLIEIAGSIGNQIGQFIARRQAEERVRHLAHYDELTGLPNRSMFNQRLSHALVQAKRHDRPLAVLFIDLDRFKNINDTLGHEAGDRVLKEIADRLHGSLRESDTVGRLGGDEFVVLIEELLQPVHVAAVAQRILAAVAQKILAAVAVPFILDAREFHITASIGISTYPDDSADMQSLLKNADISMYRAKEQGKNNFQFYSAQMNVHTLEHLELESSLRRALERDEFLLHYQPKVDIVSGRITGMEALVRWQQPAKLLVPPAQFIPLAEETGLIVPIGEWVLKTACARNKSWQDQGYALRVAVNLSARQFTHERLLQDVTRVLDETGLDPTSLELEITESMVMHNPEHAVKLLNKLKAMGIHISIDDFGTGYSSLNYLKRFPLDSVKIDRSFIRDLPGDADDAAITRAIIAMAHSLRLKVVAEGVETEHQLNFLREHGCDEMQGYYFSKPLPETEFFCMLQNAAAGNGEPILG